MVIGLLGGIGAGKSTVARLLAEAGAAVVDADRMAREVLETPSGRARVSGAFGPGVLALDGTVDRAALAARVFADPGELRKLNEIVHPGVRERVRERIREHRRGPMAGGAAGILVLDIPLLAESPLREECDGLLFVDVPAGIRISRVSGRGWPPGELERRESFQTPVDVKRRMARWTVDNSGPPEATRQEVSRVLREIGESRRRDVAQGTS